MNKVIISAGGAIACFIFGYVMNSKSQQVYIFESMSKGSAMEKTSYFLFAVGIALSMFVAKSFMNKSNEASVNKTEN